jgi:hypothetical protein
VDGKLGAEEHDGGQAHTSDDHGFGQAPSRVGEPICVVARRTRKYGESRRDEQRRNDRK